MSVKCTDCKNQRRWRSILTFFGLDRWAAEEYSRCAASPKEMFHRAPSPDDLYYCSTINASGDCKLFEPKEVKE